MNKVLKQEEKARLQVCISFLNKIGIEIIFRKIEEECFLPGLLIESGKIVIDLDTLAYPGDILHEAGHIAVFPAEKRPLLNAQTIMQSNFRDAEEMMAIAWSYAACIHLSIDPCFVFHNDGYKGGGSYIADNFKQKKYFGLPMLQWVGMTADEKNADKLKVNPYPHMIKWLRD
jgi:hypothetical protein